MAAKGARFPASVWVVRWSFAVLRFSSASNCVLSSFEVVLLRYEGIGARLLESQGAGFIGEIRDHDDGDVFDSANSGSFRRVESHLGRRTARAASSRT